MFLLTNAQLQLYGFNLRRGDFNNDGLDDLFSIDPAGQGFVALRNLQTIFDPQVISTIPSNNGGSVIVDVDQDGNLDLLGIRGSQWFVAFGDGTGALAPVTLVPATSVNSFDATDFDNDGFGDVMASRGSLGLTLYRGQGNGSFIPQDIPGTSGMNLFGVDLADVNGDGNLDVGTIDLFSAGLLFAINNGDGTFGPLTELFRFSSLFVTLPEPTDLNGDGLIDVLFLERMLPDISITALMGNGDATFETRVTTVSMGGNFALSQEVADLNNDGIPDLVVRLADFRDTVVAFLGNGDGTFNPNSEVVSRGTPGLTFVDDFNQDGNPDVLINEFALLGLKKISLGNGDGAFQVSHELPALDTLVPLGVFDVTDDSIVDIVGWNNNGFQVLPGDGMGGFGAKISTPAPVSVINRLVCSIGDVSGDGRSDLVFPSSSQEGFVYISNGDGTFQEARLANFGNDVGSEQVDLDGDGHIDLLGWRAVRALRVAYGLGGGAFEPAQSISQGATLLEARVADFNQDGLPDIAISSLATSFGEEDGLKILIN